MIKLKDKNGNIIAGIQDNGELEITDKVQAEALKLAQKDNKDNKNK